jgi:hypothetical protein
MNQLGPYLKTAAISTQDKAEHSSIAFVQSCWHKEIVDQCRIAFLDEVAKCNPQLGVDIFEVPGAFEIPLAGQTPGPNRALQGRGRSRARGRRRHLPS